MADAILSLQVNATTFVFGPTGVLTSGKALSGFVNVSKSINDAVISSYVRGINTGGLLCINGCSAGIPLMYGVTQSMVEGNPSTPSIAFNNAGMWRFKWSVAAGARTISIRCKQVSNQSPRPSMVIEANPSIGVPLDIETVAGSSIGWIDIGPVAITPTVAGCIFVKIKNNASDARVNMPAYFDHITVT